MKSLSSIVALLVASTLQGCLLFAGRHWDEARTNSISPINTAFHRHLPRDIKSKDLDAILGYYGVGTVEGPAWDRASEVSERFDEVRYRWPRDNQTLPLRQHYRSLLENFETIERAEVRIHRVYWEDPDADGIPATLRLLVRGRAVDGRRRVLDQHARVWLRQTPAGWLIQREQVTARELIESDRPHFEVATEAAGLNDVHDASASPVFRIIGDWVAASGSAVADYDCDGWEDIALLSTTHVTLFHNAANGHFDDRTQDAGLAVPFSNAATGLVFFDADNDGDPDLFISGVYGDRFYRNDNCGVFQDASEHAGIQPAAWSSMPVVADYDNDGLLDVYVIRMGDHQNGAPTPNWDARNGPGNTLYRNVGNTQFVDVTKQAGVLDGSWGLAGAWGDYNDDGYPDLYVGNEFGSNSLYRNNRDGTFTDVAADVGARDRGAAMGVAWGDYDNDGHLDLYVSNMYANSRWALFHPEFPPPVPWYLSWAPRERVLQVIDELSRGSTLLHNNGDGTFTDISDAAAIRDSQWGWGAEFLDYNNDGRLDIFATNGFVTGPLPDDV